MSTFNGIVAEFPDIRVDFFRRHPDRPPPLACFLSHVHSDHLACLDTLKSPFVYCSAATRAMLLRLQRYSCRINHAKGILEARELTYKHLKSLLVGLSRQTVDGRISNRGPEAHPPGYPDRDRNLEAGHNPRHPSSMRTTVRDLSCFAVLYTGDIRSEPWHVNALARSPSLIEYASGLKALDKIYLDTSFTEDFHFQTKAEGLRELLDKVSRYPKDTVFHFQAWTFGYENVWIALSKALNSKIHVDDYKLRMYRSLRVKHSTGEYSYLTPEAPAIAGFMCGNRFQPGCLTDDENVRLHSCEKGNYCAKIRDSPVVWIQPIVAHLPGNRDYVEVGIGGGGDDLQREAVLAFDDNDILGLLNIVEKSDSVTTEERDKIQSFLKNTVSFPSTLSLDLDFAPSGIPSQADIKSALQAVSRLAKKGRSESEMADFQFSGDLPRMVQFPYSRHSSYEELCHLVQSLRPRDVWPCTVNESEWFKNGISIQSLFGKYCCGNVFAHDIRMHALADRLGPEQTGTHDSQTTVASHDAEERERQDGAAKRLADDRTACVAEKASLSQATTVSLEMAEQGRQESPRSGSHRPDLIDLTNLSSETSQDAAMTPWLPSPRKRNFDDYCEDEQNLPGFDADSNDLPLSKSREYSISAQCLETRQAAFDAILGIGGGPEWSGLISTTNNHSTVEKELGEG